MKLLDLIVTHYQEPHDIYWKFFQMLRLQRDIDFNLIRVVLVQDGPLKDCTEQESQEIWETMLCDEPYEHVVKVIPHGGISAARNAGIKLAEAKWISFCDCDDMFSNVYSLKAILNTLWTNDFYVLLGRFYGEYGTNGLKDPEQSKRPTAIKIELPENTYVHAKYIRRDFLLETGVTFPEHMLFAEDVVFNTQVDLRVPQGKKGVINCDAPVYVWCYRPNSLSATADVFNKDLFWGIEKARLLLPDFKEYQPFNYEEMVLKTFYQFYYHASRTEAFDYEVLSLYKLYSDVLHACSPEKHHVVRDAVLSSYTPTWNSTWIVKVDKENPKGIWGWWEHLDKLVKEEAERDTAKT